MSDPEDFKPDPDHRCPTCGGGMPDPLTAFPFCSPRCRTIDLGKWVSGDYMISRPIEQSDLEEGMD